MTPIRAVLLVLMLAVGGARQTSAWNPSDDPPDLDALIAQLGAEEFAQREEATRRLILKGPESEAELREALSRQREPEIILRLRYVLENIRPPERAVLVVRAATDSPLAPGDLITHARGRRVQDTGELAQVMTETQGGAMVRILREGNPQEVGPVFLRQIESRMDYRAPHGADVAAAVRLYADGLAERAYERIARLPGGLPDRELSRLLRARLAFAAGHETTALELLKDHPDVVRPESARGLWSGPSTLDLAAPGEAPFRLEKLLYSQGGPGLYAARPGDDPDLRIQRVLVPAGRSEDALLEAAGLWWSRFRERLHTTEDNTAAGNTLAVIAWMFAQLDLASECCWLIRPRSAILSFTWVRVQTEAWLPFLAGRERDALDGFFEDARQVLGRQLSPNDPHYLTRNPQVAASVSFFLYAFPDDPRTVELLDAVNEPGHPALASYVDWMLFALTPRNAETIRRHVQQVLPSLADADVLVAARAVALLEYVRERPDGEAFLAARDRIAQRPPSPARDEALALVDVLAALAAGRDAEAQARLAVLGDHADLAVLRSTVEFRLNPPPAAANFPPLAGALLATPVDAGSGDWIVLTRELRLMRLEVSGGRITALAPPAPTWYPGPLNWPWLGRDENAGRVWVYDRRRIVELTSGDGGLRTNIQSRDIEAFTRHVSPHFARLAEALARVPAPQGESGEFRRSEIVANGEFVADPGLPEVSIIEPLAADPRVLHVACRGGPQLLIDVRSGRAWTSVDLAGRAGAAVTTRFIPVAAWPTAEAEPLLFLLSEQGLLRLDMARDELVALDLPDGPPRPPLIPEWQPYVRRDPRYVCFARLPADGGRVYRLTIASGAIEPLDMVNEALPRQYDLLRSRDELRSALERRFAAAGLPTIEAFIEDARAVVERWQKEHAP